MSDRYRGMAYPWGQTLASYFEPKGDRDVLRTSIETIIFTRIYERVMLPGFGSPIHEAPFEPSDEQLDETLAAIVRDNVTFWDGRVEVLDVQVSDDLSGAEKMVTVVYQDKAIPDVEDRFTFNIPSEVISRID